jgi:thiamine-monophosphate kinase
MTADATVAAWGEFRLIDELFRRGAGAQGHRADVRAGIGDDAAVLAAAGDDDWVAAVDTVTEGVHCRPGSDAYSLGWKAVAVNVSDLAAMGAEPRHALLAAGLPADLPRARAEALAEGLHAALEHWGIALVGGDTTATAGGPLTLSLTLLGRAAPEQVLRRSGARVGDTLYVTGTLGEAAAGLEVAGEPDMPDGFPYDHLLTRHLRPEPPLGYGLGIAEAASAAIDISDGLLADLGHLSAASGVALEVDSARLPYSGALGEWCWTRGRDPEPLALHGGEDFELAFTAGPEAFEALHRAKYTTDTRFTPIGRVIDGPLGAVLGPDGARLDGGGYDHFGDPT